MFWFCGTGISVILETRLRAGQPGFNSRQGLWWNFSLRRRVQTGSGAHATAYPLGTGNKVAGVWSWSLSFM